MGIAAAVIAGDSLQRDDWERMEQSLRPHVQSLALSWNGRSSRPPRWLRSTAGLAWAHLPWDDDFAEQRNHSFELVPEEHEWILWIDTDDTLAAPDGLGFLHELDPLTTGVFLPYDYGHDPETGVVIVRQQRERILSRRARWRWVYPIHEVCQSGVGTQLARRDDAWIVHHREPRHNPATRERNRRILVRALREHPDVSRFKRYLADETYTESDLATGEERVELLLAAGKAYGDYVREAPWEDDAYTANHRMADIQRELGEHARAIDTELQGIKLRASWPDSYNGIALSCLELGDAARAEEWADLCLRACAAPDTSQAIEPLELVYTPHLLRGLAKRERGDLEGALGDLRIAQSVWNPKDLDDRVRKLQEQYDSAEADAPMPGPKRSANLTKGGRERSVAFFTRPLSEPWHPLLEEKGGIGGAETCVMRLAKRFAEDGWRTTVFGTPGEHAGEHDGVEYWPSTEFVAAEPWRVVIASRVPELFDSELNADVKLLWLHHVNLRDELLAKDVGLAEGRLDRFDATVCLSQWHAMHTRALYSDVPPIDVIPNGIESSWYDREPEPRTEPRFVYSSSPDRGLDVLLGLWPEIVGKWPGATLDVYYGWESIDAIVRSNPGSRMAQGLAAFKQYVVSLVDRLNTEHGGGITMHGRVPQRELAKRLHDATVWSYPTYFMETHCLTAIEMQLAGVIPVTSRLAALEETVAMREQLVEGWPNNSHYQRAWLRKLEQTMAMLPTHGSWMQQRGREHALRYDWDAIYRERWLPLVEGRRAVGSTLTGSASPLAAPPRAVQQKRTPSPCDPRSCASCSA